MPPRAPTSTNIGATDIARNGESEPGIRNRKENATEELGLQHKFRLTGAWALNSSGATRFDPPPS